MYAIGFSIPSHICAKHALNALSDASLVNTTGNFSEKYVNKGGEV